MIAKLSKWIIIAFVSFLVVGILCIMYFKYNPNTFYELREHFNKNSIFIYTKNNLDINKVDVYWSSEINSGHIIKNGKETDLIFKEYGPNEIIVLYDKDTIKKFIYFKSNNWHGNKHLISLSKNENEKIEAEIKIIGPDNN